MARTGSLTEFAAHIGVTKPYVSQLRKDGRLVLSGPANRPVVDFAASKRLISETGQFGSANNGANAGGRGRGADAEDPASARVGQVYRQSQAQHKAYAAKLAELEYKKRAGLLIDAAAMHTTVFEVFRGAREAIMLVPKRCAGALVGQDDPKFIERVVEDEIRQAFVQWERQIRASIAGLGAARA